MVKKKTPTAKKGQRIIDEAEVAETLEDIY
jgi:hypothetical protein